MCYQHTRLITVHFNILISSRKFLLWLNLSFCTLVFIYDSYILIESACQIRRQFSERFFGVEVSSRQTFHQLVHTFQENGSVADKKYRKQQRILMDETLDTDNISLWLECCPCKSINHPTQKLDFLILLYPELWRIFRNKLDAYITFNI